LQSFTIQNNLINISFLLSFLITLYYWIKTIFFFHLKKQPYGFLGFFTINVVLIIELSIRWIKSGHFPLSSLYESLIFLSWGIITLYLIIEKSIKNELIGIVIAPLILFLLGFTSFSLPVELQTIKPLVPALQSNWLFMHVSVMIISYAALLIGSLISITYLIVYLNQPMSTNPIINKDLISESAVFLQIPEKTPNLNNTNILELLDNLSYRILGFGFCFLTLGILSGAVWANETWGSYWSWDPKETWALITWLTFAIYLHTRLIYNWEGIKSAIISTIGFVFIWICYLGVNLLGKGLHSYGFFS
jgi:cytochrome c-type biogenesis protein CcsB